MTHFIPTGDTNKDGYSIVGAKLRELSERYKALGSRIHLVEHKTGADLLEHAYFQHITRDDRPRFTPTHTITIARSPTEECIGGRE